MRRDESAPARMVLGGAEAQVEAVTAGFGIAQLATWLVADELAADDMVQLLPDQITNGLPLHPVWVKRRERSPKVDPILSLLGDELRIY